MINFLYYAGLYFAASFGQFIIGKFAPYGVYPNIILVVIVYLGLTRGPMAGQLLGFIFGLTWDMFSTDIFGARALMFTIVGYIAGRLSKDMHAYNAVAQIAVTFIASVIVWAGLSTVYFAASDFGAAATYFNISPVYVYRVIILVLIAPVIFHILDFFEGIITDGLAKGR